MVDLGQAVREHPILAILRNVPFELTLDYAGAILEGGVSFFEVSLNSPRAAEQIDLLRRHFGERALVGAGTAIDLPLVRRAVDAGAQFLLSPSTDPDVLDYCREERLAMLPGVMTPSDVSACVRRGYRVLKLFPAGDLPLSFVKDLKGPFDGTDYVAIGGVNRANAADFLRAGCIGVGLGSNLLPADAVARRDWPAASAAVAELRQTLGA